MRLHAHTWRALGPALVAAIASIVAAGSGAAAQQDGECGGFVFHDLDADGRRAGIDGNDGGTGEIGVAGARVELLDAEGARFTSTTVADGSWTAPQALAFPIRADFVAPDGFEIGPAGADAGLTTQLIATEDACAQPDRGNVGVHVPGEYCTANPDIVTSCFVVGDAREHDDQAAIVAVAYETTDNAATDGKHPADWLSPLYETRATVGEVGSVHGLAVAADGAMYAAAFVKRHARLESDLNPSGNPTVVYRIPLDGDPEVFSIVDPQATNPHEGIGEPGDYKRDHDVIDDVFTTGLGDLQLAGDELFTIDLGNRQLVSIDIDSGEIVRRIALDGPALGVAGCAVEETNPFGDLRAFGLGLDRDRGLLIGVVCSAASTVSDADFPIEGPAPGNPAGDDSELIAYVFDYDGAGFELRLAWPLAGDRGRMQENGQVSQDAAWHPWVDVYPFDSEPDAVAYPQPAVTDLIVDSRGDLIVAIGDRWGHQGAPFTTSPAWDGGTREVEEPLVTGDLQRACLTDRGWVIEGRPGCSGGLGSAEHFGDDRYGVHDETAMGSVLQVPGRDEIVATHMNPIPEPDTWRSGGFIWHDVERGRARRGVRLYDGRHASPDETFEKATGLGGLALDCGSPPIQFASVVWFDADADRIRDVDEPGIAGVEMVLFDSRGETIAATETDGEGRYFFDHSNVASRLVIGEPYRVAISPANFEPGGVFVGSGRHAGMGLSPPSEAPDLDSNAVVTADGEPWATTPSVAAVAGDLPETTVVEALVDHSLGFAIANRYDLALVSLLDAIDLEARTISFEIIVANQGSEPSGAFSVVDQLPAGVSFVEAHPDGVEDPPGSGEIVFSFDEADELAAGEQTTLWISGVLDDLVLEYVNGAEIVADSGADEDSSPAGSLSSPDSRFVVEALSAAVLESDALTAGVDEHDHHDITRVGTAEIGGLLFVDSDGSLTFDESESPVVGGVEVALVDPLGDTVAVTSTGSDGRYVFSLLLPGSYRVILSQAELHEAGLEGSADEPAAKVGLSQGAEQVRSALIVLDGSSPVGEGVTSPSSTLDRASDLTVDFALRRSGGGLDLALVVGAGAATLIAALLIILKRRRRPDS